MYLSFSKERSYFPEMTGIIRAFALSRVFGMQIQVILSDPSSLKSLWYWLSVLKTRKESNGVGFFMSVKMFIRLWNPEQKRVSPGFLNRSMWSRRRRRSCTSPELNARREPADEAIVTSLSGAAAL